MIKAFILTSQLNAWSNEIIQRFVFLKHINSYYDIFNHPMGLDMPETKLPLRTKMTDYHQGREPLAWA